MDSLTLASVQQRILQQAPPGHADCLEWRLLSAGGLAEEAGEVFGVVKKIEGKPLGLNRGHAEGVDAMAKLDEELGDALWQLVTTANNYRRSLDAIARKNLAKVDARYGLETLPAGVTSSRNTGRVEYAELCYICEAAMQGAVLDAATTLRLVNDSFDDAALLVDTAQKLAIALGMIPASIDTTTPIIEETP